MEVKLGIDKMTVHIETDGKTREFYCAIAPVTIDLEKNGLFMDRIGLCLAKIIKPGVEDYMAAMESGCNMDEWVGPQRNIFARHRGTGKDISEIVGG